jgi:hypothetical protein
VKDLDLGIPDHGSGRVILGYRVKILARARPVILLGWVRSDQVRLAFLVVIFELGRVIFLIRVKIPARARPFAQSSRVVGSG